MAYQSLGTSVSPDRIIPNVTAKLASTLRISGKRQNLAIGFSCQNALDRLKAVVQEVFLAFIGDHLALGLKFKVCQDCKGIFQVAAIAPTTYAVVSGIMIAETALAVRDVEAVPRTIFLHTLFRCLEYLST